LRESLSYSSQHILTVFSFRVHSHYFSITLWKGDVSSIGVGSTTQHLSYEIRSLLKAYFLFYFKLIRENWGTAVSYIQGIFNFAETQSISEGIKKVIYLGGGKELL